MFQTICKWIVNDETELVQEDEVSFHLLKENVEKETIWEDSMVTKSRIGNCKEGNSHSIAGKQWKSQLMQHGIVDLMEIRQNETCGLFVQEYIQSQMGIRCPQGDRLEDEIIKLWNLMQFFKRRCNKVRRPFHCEVELKMKNSEGRDSGILQHKFWNPGRLQPIRSDGSESH